MTVLDEAEYAKLAGLVEKIEAISGADRDASTGMPVDLARMKERIAVIEREGGIPGVEGEQKRKNRAAAADVAMIVAEDSRLSAQAQMQFDGFLVDGFRNKKDLDQLSQFISENEGDLNFGQRVQIVDEVLDGVERRDYEVDDIPNNVLGEVQVVLENSEVNASVTANLSTSRIDILNEALASVDPEKLREALKDQEIFAACHEYVSETRERFETQKDGREAVEEDVVKTSETVDEAVDSSVDFLASIDPTDLSPQNSSQREH